MNTSRTMKSDRPGAMSRPMAENLEAEGEDLAELLSEISTSVGRYCRARPRVVAGIIFSCGFVIGWKLRPW